MILKLLIFVLLMNSAWAESVSRLFRYKDYVKIAETYSKPQQFKLLSRKELVMVSYALRKTKHYKADTRVVAFLIRQQYHTEHRKIQKHIKLKETLDSEDYPKSLPILYWSLYFDHAQILLSYKRITPDIEKDKMIYNTFRTIIGELEYKEGMAEKLNNKVVSHLQYLQDKIYRFSSSWNLQYISWQHSTTLHRASTNKETGLIITNKGYCVGGDVGIENGFSHYYLDGCLLIGDGGVSAYGDADITYEQNIPAMGLKLGPAASMFVSSTKAQIGLGLPIIFTSQKLTQPDDSDYSVKEGNPFSFLATINSRWQFDKWYIRTEFGQYFKKQESFWGLGFGRQF